MPIGQTLGDETCPIQRMKDSQQRWLGYSGCLEDFVSHSGGLLCGPLERVDDFARRIPQIGKVLGCELFNRKRRLDPEDVHRPMDPSAIG